MCAIITVIIEKATVIPVVVGALGAVPKELIGEVDWKDWDWSESRAFAKNGISRNSQDFENGAYTIKEMDFDLETFGYLL